jgi:fructose-1,6-bisphosphatase/inositol monophosphatase family enzyme
VTITIVEGRRVWSHPALLADAIHKGDWAEESYRITQAGAPSGTLTIYLVDPLDGTTKAIATQVVA